ncbi:MAG: Gfo/Idh/MocA family oxidoreductase [Chloroflexi bacterium]|nr:Gfo/Idh/MocA family oxidoreductase [Chloroflexota bacterium]
MAARVRVGIVGVGSMGANHARVYSMLRTADLVGVVDPDAAARDRIASGFGVQAFAHHRDLIGKVDAVSVATPTALHVPIALDLLAAGVHVLVEKPISLDLDDAWGLTAAAERRGLVLQVGHVERFNPAVLEASSIVASERVLAITARRLSPPTPRVHEDVVLDLMIHDIDIALSIARSRVRSIGALGATDERGELEIVMAHLGFENGILADLIASKVTQQRVRDLELTTDRSLVVVNYRQRDLSVYRNARVDPVGTTDQQRYRQEAVIEKPIVPTSEPLYLELEHFLDCVRGLAPRLHPREAIEALDIAMRVRAAARSVAAEPA